VKDVQACRVTKIDWSGRVVYVGLDLSETNDNTSVGIVAVDDDNRILADSYAFIPEDRINEKTASEKVNYRELIQSGKVIACGDRVIDYGVVEAFILSLEERMGVQIQAVGYDRWNALSTAQKLEKEGLNMVEIKQHSSVLHPPTKLLREKILSREFQYEKNTMLEINFQNAQCVYDNNRNAYVNKKKSRGKIDMVVGLINATYLLQQDVIFGSDFFVQTF
jgi:phage terminase large subunit-like protein